MISLFSINQFINIDCDRVPKNQWYSVDRQAEILSDFLELEKKIVFRQGLTKKYKISFAVSDINSHLLNPPSFDEEGNKLNNKYVLLIPLVLNNPDKVMLSTYLNDSDNSLIINSKMNNCVGWNDCKVTPHIIEYDNNNCYLFIRFTTTTIRDSLPIDSITQYIERIEKVKVSLANKKEIDFLEIDKEVFHLFEYIKNYQTRNIYTFLKFTKGCTNLNKVMFDSPVYISSSFFKDSRINNYGLQHKKLAVFKTNICMYEHYFKTNIFNINQIYPSDIENYIIHLVKQYFQVKCLTYNNDYCITVSVCNTQPDNAIIMIPFSKENEIKDKHLYFCELEPYSTIEEKKINNVNNIYAIEQSADHVYFIENCLFIKKKNIAERYCFITLNEPTYTDSSLFIHVKNKEHSEIMLEEIPIINSMCDVNPINVDASYNEFTNEVNQQYIDIHDEDIIISSNCVKLLSKNWFDKINKIDNENMFDILNYTKVINENLLNVLIDVDNNSVAKKLYIEVAPFIRDHFRLNSLNVIQTNVYELDNIAHFVPPENCIFMYIFLQHSSNITIKCNNCTQFNPICTSGSILIHTFKKEIIMKTDSKCTIFIYTIKMI